MGATVSDADSPDCDAVRALHIRVSGPLRDALDRFALLCGVSRSEAVRLLLLRSLEALELWPPSRNEVRNAP